MTPAPPKLIACVRPINWAIERLRRRRASLSRKKTDRVIKDDPASGPPLALVQTTANRQIVVTMCPLARNQGIRAGLSLAQARALCPNLVYAQYDPARDAKALEALGRWMMRFTPAVQVAEGGLFLDVTGTQRLFGSLEKLLAKIHGALTNLRIPARLAIAPTPGAAWAMTFQTARSPIVTTDLSSALSPLPPLVLRLDDPTLAALHHLGLSTVEQLLAIPRDLLPARFGPMLLLRLDQALGRIAEPLVPLLDQPPIEAAVEFDGVVDSLEMLWLSFQDLIAQVANRLVRGGLGARRLIATFHRPYAPAIEKTIDLSRPSRNVTILFNLIRCTMETIGDARPTRGKRPPRFRLRATVKPSGSQTLDDSDFIPRGFTGLRLAVPIFERLSEEQIFLLEQEEQQGQADLDRLVERLHIRLGEQALVAVEPVESHVPEKAYRKGSGFRVQGSAKKKTEKRNAPATLLHSIEPYALNPEPSLNPESSHRPLYLLPTPCSLRVMVRPSHDRDGAPVSFTLDGHVHRIVHAVGPERIGGVWWLGNNKTRDYFDVEDETGRRWWLFRVLQTSKWYLHGRFE